MEAAEKVLVVDDEPQVLVALEDLLSEGYVILKASSVDEARAIMAREPDIAVVVTDQRMPRATGSDLISSMLNTSHACAIMLTGYADLSAVVRAVNEGRLFAYVTKPWDPSDLRGKIANAASYFRLSRQLEHEQRLLHDLMDYSPDGMYFKGADLRFQRINRAYSELLGASGSGEEWLGKDSAEVFSESAKGAEWHQVEQQVLRERTPRVDMVRRYEFSGERRWISETVAPILGDAGAAIGLLGITRDVTERIEAQEALRASERRFREQSELLNSILDGMAEGVLVADAAGRLVFFNRNAERLLGTISTERTLATWVEHYQLCCPETSQLLTAEEEPLTRALRSNAASQREVLVDSVGKGRILVISAAPLTDSAQASAGVVALLRDVTEQRTLERRLAQTDKMEAIGRVAGGVAHDFNNLLAIIQTYAELVLVAVESQPEVHDDVQELLNTTDRAATLTRQLLEFSRQRLTQRVALSLSTVTQSMVDMLRRILTEAIDLRVDLAANLGNTRADVGQIEQIVLNLVINARDAMPEGGTLQVRTYQPSAEECRASELPSAEFIGLSVADSGTGIRKDALAKIFEPFFTTKPVGRGTGLGLATVYGIVHQYGGQIRVESEVGSGTTFSIYLPRTYASDPVAPGSGPVRQRQTRHATILLVEDDPALRPIIARVLRQEGHRVLEAENAQRALRILEQTKSSIDLLLTDVILPGDNGLKLADMLRAKDERLRVLFVSGYGKDILTSDHLEPGMVACLEKPFTPTRLLETIQSLLASSGRAVGASSH